MKTFRAFPLLLLALSILTAAGAEMKCRVFQPPYAANAKDEPASSRWLLDELAKCDESLDLDMGIDTILTDDYLHISAATGLR